jgi:hypothetical protein
MAVPNIYITFIQQLSSYWRVMVALFTVSEQSAFCDVSKFYVIALQEFKNKGVDN